MINATMQKIQSKYKTDVAGFGDSLRIANPKYWRRVENHWDDVFSQTPVTFEIKLSITDYGASKQ